MYSTFYIYPIPDARPLDANHLKPAEDAGCFAHCAHHNTFLVGTFSLRRSSILCRAELMPFTKSFHPTQNPPSAPRDTENSAHHRTQQHKDAACDDRDLLGVFSPIPSLASV
jgi:hypothetical protein